MNLRSVDLNLLVVLEAVMDERSVSAAARRLGLTQSAVSHALRRLRALFGDRLLVRGPGGMVPTPRAVEIGAALGDALGRIEAAVSGPRSFDPRTAHRTFTLRVSEYVAPLLLPPLCAAIRREARGVRLNLAWFVTGPAGGETAPQPGELHVRTSAPDPVPAGCSSVRLLADTFAVLMGPRHPAADEPLTLDRYVGLSHVKVGAPALGTNLIDDALAARGLERTVVLTVPSWFEMRDVVARTDLVVAVPLRWAGAPEFSAGCRWQPLPLPEIDLAVDLLWRTRDGHDPGHEWLRELIVETTAGDERLA